MGTGNSNTARAGVIGEDKRAADGNTAVQGGVWSPSAGVGKATKQGKKQGQAAGLGPSDVERVKRRFARLAGPKGTVHISQFQQMVELGGNPFLVPILRLFDSNKDDELTSSEFSKALEYFGSLHDEEEQYKFAFRLYDTNNDGLISGPELFAMLSMLMSHAYQATQLEQVVLHTMQEFDHDGDGSLNLEEFKQLLSGTDLVNKFNVHIS
mmetsp:Transcript_18845/g.32186  ORF Transcript_18845/g.32186 Transcript_18845/m.32186 type:complete len:210 (+) Transcript_18845:73-702(+)|eukprot:CAMPEP_0119109392 /NCGR_PEP_ID=MMETSP1180-20130426/17885_1 /TAXON_ID=3052 ORGANISM="Chlamydomonas cf sp, Strain CCMP681" /NCGR_SAMPLE_ID=MMETSP1180 /ASSEMBLY_ACC=CAM_ASM_000741 /LENGTH=209 /DNA_ID=CAMNT_0007095145 /DNA_START=71 /DNA_END=700 /DNA_ORIENTATION=+